MTGFGSAANSDFTVEIRSVNHRFIDIVIKMPSYMNQYEINLRNILKEKFQRGRFDVNIFRINHKTPKMKLNKDLAKNIYSALQDLQKELSISGKININTLTEYREILIEEESYFDIDSLYSVFYEAVSNLETMRIQEGEHLAEEIRQRIEALSAMNNRIKTIAPEIPVKWREKFTERLKSILVENMVDTNRIIQEAAIMAEKLDIAEEISRIENHLAQFKEISHHHNSIGKQLDFLLQEISREVNTLSYKSNDVNISHLVVEMKTEIEKIREQVQNIQ